MKTIVSTLALTPALSPLSFKLLACCVAGLALLCSCATQDSIRPPLPAETSMNKGAGSGAQLILMLRLESGEEHPFAMDTGSAFTIVDNSLKEQLGRRVGTAIGNVAGQAKEKMEVHEAPKLFLGDTRLSTAPQVLTRQSGRIGLLGMDCLRHYCIQLDFVGRKIRFLDPDHLNPQELGKAFPLAIKEVPKGGAQAYVDTSLFENDGVRFWIDTGFFGEGDFLLQSKLYQRVVRNHQPNRAGEALRPGLPRLGVAELSRAEFAGETYGDVRLGEIPEQVLNVPGWISLQFLSRHLVTLNFPKRVMYLKPVQK